ncbi:hypothetical protein LXA43DRAFT_1096520 [Ganoderma leucocontextum]|nr:hypothetical protein LXA43DRAFT_1096520 [Ganoderma leucocontextum]
MAQNYLPFPTSLNAEEALLVKVVLQDCIPCNVMCMAPHTMPRHSRYTHIHDFGSSLFVTITTRMHRDGTAHLDSFKALIEDTRRLLMKGVSLPVGHYPVSDTLSRVQTISTISPSTAPPPAGEIPIDDCTTSAATATPPPAQSDRPTEITFVEDATSAATATPPPAQSDRPSEITLTSVESMYN